MKRIYTYILLTLGLLVISCQDDLIDSQHDFPATVDVDAQEEYAVNAEVPGRIVFNIRANTPWSIATDSDWCSTTPSTSAESSLVSEVTVYPQDNQTFQSRTATITISSEELGVVKTIRVVQAKMKEKVSLTIGNDPKNNKIVAGDGMPGDTIVDISADKVWTLSASDIPDWLHMEKLNETSLKVSIKETNTSLAERQAYAKIEIQGVEQKFEFPFKVVQPSPFIVADGARLTTDVLTGYTKVEFTKGEMFRSAYTMKKGKMIIELDDMKMSSIYNLGFNFTATSSANFKLHMEAGNTYWFRCAGGFSWVAPIKKTFTMEEVNAIRKLEFAVADDPDSPGKVMVSIYIDGEHFGTQKGRTDIFSAGDPGCHFIFEAGSEPTSGDYCIFKSIKYVNN